MNFCVGEEVGELHAAVALVVDDRAPAARGGALVADSTWVQAAASPTCVGVDAEVGQRARWCTGFFLAAMIPLNEG